MMLHRWPRVGQQVDGSATNGNELDGRGLSRWLQLLEAVHFPDIQAASCTKCYQLYCNLFGNAQECRTENRKMNGGK